MKIGVISDTHNYLDPKIPLLFAGVERILHGGDVGLPWLIQELESIAPVTAVSGNTDEPGLGYRATELTKVDGWNFLVHHIVNPHALTPELQAAIARARPDVVVFGHTHKPFQAILDGTLFFNPGYAGKSRFGMARSVAILHVGEGGIRPEYVQL